jgi:PAS domain S-box-containing protein
MHIVRDDRGPAASQSRESVPWVLFVDDEGLLLQCYVRLLRSVKANVIPVESAEEALRALESQRFDVVIADYSLPGMNGGQLLERVRDRWPATVRILISGALGVQVGAETMDESIRGSKVHRFLLKPCEPNELRAVVLEAIQQARGSSVEPLQPLAEHPRHAAHQQAFESAIDPMMICDLAGNVLEANEALVQSLGGARSTALARRPRLVSGWDVDWDEVHEELQRCGHWRDEVQDRANDRHALLRVTVVHDEGGRPVALSVVERDSTEARRAEKEALAVQQNLLLAVSRLAEFRDPETGAHLKRIRSYARTLALELANSPRYAAIIDAGFVHTIYVASPLHDVGKVAIPDGILLKPGKLTDKEFAVMKTHSRVGAEILAHVGLTRQVPFLDMAEKIALQHHEKFDGSGYPDGLCGDQIDLAARIVALADVYDACTSDRVYHAARSHGETRQIILDGEGTHFDPEIVQAFLRSEELFQQIRLAHSDSSDEKTDPGSRTASQVFRAINKLLDAQRNQTGWSLG